MEYRRIPGPKAPSSIHSVKMTLSHLYCPSQKRSERVTLYPLLHRQLPTCNVAKLLPLSPTQVTDSPSVWTIVLRDYCASKNFSETESQCSGQGRSVWLDVCIVCYGTRSRDCQGTRISDSAKIPLWVRGIADIVNGWMRLILPIGKKENQNSV